MDLQLDEEDVVLEGYPLDYDPHNPSLDYSPFEEMDSLPSHTPSFGSEPAQKAGQSYQKVFYFFPEESSFTDEGIEYRRHFISHDSGNLECSKIQGRETFAPITITPAVWYLLERPELVRQSLESSGSERLNFWSLTKACNIYAYRGLKFQPGPINSHTVTTCRAPTFVATIPNIELLTPAPFKKTPLLVDLATNSNSFLDIYAFAIVPMLPKDCHKLGAVLANVTTPVPISLRTRDFESSLFSPSLFHVDAVKRAEDCCKDGAPSDHRLLTAGCVDGESPNLNSHTNPAQIVSPFTVLWGQF